MEFPFLCGMAFGSWLTLVTIRILIAIKNR